MSLIDQKLGMAHVYGHCDFFRNHAYFAHTSRNMMDEMANPRGRASAPTCRSCGEHKVEAFMDRCMPIDDLIDIKPAQVPAHAGLSATESRRIEEIKRTPAPEKTWK